MSCTFKIAIAAFAAAAVAPIAFAEKPVTRSAEVAYSDLDLSRDAGVQTLLKRIESASKRVCGKRPTSVRFGQMEAFNGCRANAQSEAVRRINNPTVSIAYAQSIGASPLQLSSR